MDDETEPCNVCGGTDSKLIDGFYYCIECGTQNTNVRETVIEDKALGDGTFAQTVKRKISHVHKEGIEMSGEWYRWHAFNFIISGLANDLVTLGAKPTFKIKLLWIWTRYIKKYQNKAELTINNSQEGNDQTGFFSLMVEEESRSNLEVEEETPDDETNKKIDKCSITDGSRRDIKFLSKGLILAMLYVALNLDESDIQLSHLYRFLQEKHFDIWNLNRFVPEDINVKKIPQWTNFLRSKLCTQHQVRALAMSLLRKLDLGTPKVPDLRKVTENFLTELCLPDDIKPLVYSLMHYRKCDFLDIDDKAKNFLMRIPDYEGTVMTNILVAIKICFGLDNDYEIKLSDVVDKINLEKDLPKSYKIGKYSELSDRLFSFREWCSYLQFRKVMLSKHNLRIAERNCLDVNDYVYLEHIEERPKNNEELPDKISMEIISRLPQERNLGVIPKNLFIPTLTPLSEYTDIVVEYCQDPDIRLKLAEDFKRYSLKYACENLELLDLNNENIFKGVSKDKKSESKVILGSIVTKKAKTKMVYVKNCENRNWLKTNPPTIEHVICADEAENETNDKESDHGYESEITSKERDLDNIIDKSSDPQSIIEDISKDTESQHNESEDTLKGTTIIEDNAKDSRSTTEQHRKEIGHENNLENVLIDRYPVIDKSLDYPTTLQDIIEDTDNAKEDSRHEVIQEYNSFENVLKEQDLGSIIDENFSDNSIIEDNATNNKKADRHESQKIIQERNDSVPIPKENELDIIKDTSITDSSAIEENVVVSKNAKEEQKREIIEEENIDKNIFDDCFEDLTFKEECEQNKLDNWQINEDGNEDNNQLQNTEIPDEDFDRRSDTSDVLLPKFNPETFDRDKTIKELILHTCKKYKIAIPTEYRIKEPRKRKEPNFGNDVPTTRPKRAKYEGKATAKQLLSNYYSYIQSDFVSKVQQEMSLAVRNAELENQSLQQNNDLSNTNLQISLVERNYMSENGIDSTIARSETDSTIGPINEDLNVTNKTDTLYETADIDVNLENTLFEDDEEMKLDDVIPKGDPKFDEEMYETDQLYIKVKDEQDDVFFDGTDDPEIDKILMKKIEQCEHGTEFAKLKAKPKENSIKMKEESDSEDDIPLSVFKEELSLIEEMYRQEDNYERLIKKEDIPEYKYWIRHYDRDFMLRSIDWHAKFDEELKENMPTSFNFVIQECASILNCSNFYLYKSMQNLEEYLVTKAKNKKLRSNNLDTDSHIMLSIYEECIE